MEFHVQLFTAVWLVISQHSWKNRNAWKLVSKEKRRRFAMLYLQAEADIFCFEGPLQIHHSSVSRDPVFQGTELAWRMKRYAVEMMIELLSLSYPSTEIWCFIIKIQDLWHGQGLFVLVNLCFLVHDLLVQLKKVTKTYLICDYHFPNSKIKYYSIKCLSIFCLCIVPILKAESVTCFQIMEQF